MYIVCYNVSMSLTSSSDMIGQLPITQVHVNNFKLLLFVGTILLCFALLGLVKNIVYSVENVHT